MEIKLTATIFQDAKNLFTAQINEIRCVVAQGETLNEAKQELLKILRIKLELERKKQIAVHSENVTTEEYNFILA